MRCLNEAVYMESSYPAARVTRLAGVEKTLCLCETELYPASAKHMFWDGQLQRAKLQNCVNKSK